ncbi:16S rRNA (guanine(966)-N(2))-methyltransferase RsmD [Geomesophilobacter sediminis]|uniref:16S rRNA (Guanine(966)-N(2))-methyltransferase RsmD n=1 Tax=Geomesophilobacter sediminis TaxID=2798584 RepID=A0A8J7JDQ3_9BACT|nr:16S rRNA (guanine(966)-N(2))-methyltransferase RsmD [Geomesophilobacter sediminis]MBJ6723819.1 16S rRNA (guanine(966)-N(2))-methyltransferase RsmD [Geomesophilobacter sediminis]
MRVISGTARGRQLLPPKDMRVRPTADRVKEALFSILISRVGEMSEMRVLDLFAGTGSLGIEALSRGAGFAVFVDSHRDSAALIRKNLELTRLDTNAKVVIQEVASALRLLAKSQEAFHLIFLDPPYQKGLAASTLELLAESPLVGEATVIVSEYSAKEEMPKSFGRLEEADRRTYGDTTLSILTVSRRGESCP